MCGILAAEYQTLPRPMRDAVIGFFDEQAAVARGRARHRARAEGR